MVLLLCAALAACADYEYSRHASRQSAGYAGPPPTVYAVRRGDTLYAIAWRYGLNYREVARWNDIEPPYTIYPGQRLRLRPTPRSAATPGREGAPARERAARSTEARTQPGTADEPVAAGKTRRWRWPVQGKVLRRFRDNGPGKRGIAIAGTPGMAIHAAAPGRVVYSGSGLRGYGKLLIIRHDSRYLTAYGFNRRLLVSEGDAVAAGESVARMGEQAGLGAALHFEIRRDGKPVDPLPLLPAR